MIYDIDVNGKVTQNPFFDGKAPLSCALGCFDGVHIGHRALITEAVADKEKGYLPAIWTFSKPLGDKYIENVPSRLSICGTLGIEKAICEDFETVRETSPEAFISHLFYDLGVRKFICGCDFRFGYNRQGSADTIKKVASELGAEVAVIPPVMLSDQNATEKVSSTYIRSLIANGDVESANKLLARPFSVTQEIRQGKHIGRTMDFPTVNQGLESGRIVPRFGVYCSACVFNGKRYPSVTNIGIRPTVNSDVADVTCETHIIGEKLDLYGEKVTVELYRFIRPEKRFNSLSELQVAIENDCKFTEKFFLLS